MDEGKTGRVVAVHTGEGAITDVHFDSALNGWVVSRYRDVVASLREPMLLAVGSAVDVASAATHSVVRSTAIAELSERHRAVWRDDLQQSADVMAARLSANTPIDLVADFAASWSLQLAVRVSGAAPGRSHHLSALASRVYLAAAHSRDGSTHPDAAAAAAELASALAASGMSIGVQAFVALSHTLPGLLANVWRALALHADVAQRMRANPDMIPRAVDELLRFAGSSRVVFRRAAAPLTIGTVQIGARDLVFVMLALANRDSERFADPDRLDLDRGATRHLAFGLGLHACVGATLVREAVASATSALLRATTSFAISGEPHWMDGFAIRAPTTLPVVLHRSAV